MKKVMYRRPRRTQGPPAIHRAWDFGVEGLVLYKRPNDNKSWWTIIHLSSHRSVVHGPTRDEALRALLRFPPIDWSGDAESVCLQLDMAYDHGTGQCVKVEEIA